MGGSMYGSSYGGMGSSMYGGGYGASSMYGSSGMYGGDYGANSMYGGGGYGSSMYGGGGMYGRPMYGGGMYGGPGGMMGGMTPPFDPNHPPPAPPTAWQHFLVGINGIMQFFGRLSFLVDENAHAVHFFISALLQMLDRAGSLYGEVARFILRIIFRRSRHSVKGGDKQQQQQQQQQQLMLHHQHQGMPGGPHGPHGPMQHGLQHGGMGGPPPLALPPGPSSSEPAMLPSAGQWENLWGDS